jgi:hypothetical protein
MLIKNGPFVETTTIANAASVSGSITRQLDTGQALAGFVMPAAWTAASITFEVSIDGGTNWRQLYYAGGVYTIAAAGGAAASLAASLVREVFEGWPLVRFRSGTTAVPVAQAAERIITLVFKQQF